MGHEVDFSKAIYEHLPIGVEFYDADGFFIRMNEKNRELLCLPISSNEPILNIKTNPMLPESVRRRIGIEDEITTLAEYNFETARQFYPTSGHGIIYIEIRVLCLRAEDGTISVYMYLHCVKPKDIVT